jgi:VWFA-related protein
MDPSRQVVAAVATVLIGLALGPPQAPTTFSTRTDMVRLEVAVLDDHGPVRGLRATDFSLSDSGGSTQFGIDEFVDVPLDVVAVLQPEASYGGVQGPLFEAATKALLGSLRASDRLGVVVAGTPPVVIRPLSDAVSSIERALLGGTPSGALFDGIATGLATFPASESRRKLLIVIGDGIDRFSVVEPTDLARRALRLDPQIILIGAAPTLVDRVGIGLVQRRSGGALEPEVTRVEYKNRFPGEPLRVLADSTGGRIVDLNSNNPRDVVPRLVAALRFGYLITYPSPRTTGWHPVTLKTKNRNLKVLTRTGYYVD